MDFDEILPGKYPTTPARNMVVSELHRLAREMREEQAVSDAAWEQYKVATRRHMKLARSFSALLRALHELDGQVPTPAVKQKPVRRRPRPKPREVQGGTD